MAKEDPEKLRALFEEHREEYLKEAAAVDEGDQKRRRQHVVEDETVKEEALGQMGFEDIDREAMMEDDVEI